MSTDRLLAFYDGQCGLCHMAVVFLLRWDKSGVLHFAPIQSETYHKFAAEKRVTLTPRSILVHAPKSDELLRESDAVLHLLTYCGPVWSSLAKLFAKFPRPLRDGTYRSIARVRHRLIRPPTALVPTLPQHLRSRIHA